MYRLALFISAWSFIWGGCTRITKSSWRLRMLPITFRVSGGSPKNLLPNKFSGDADVAGPWVTFFWKEKEERGYNKCHTWHLKPLFLVLGKPMDLVCWKCWNNLCHKEVSNSIINMLGCLKNGLMLYLKNTTSFLREAQDSIFPFCSKSLLWNNCVMRKMTTNATRKERS